jgi:ubiquinone/menaquinone biosynthesis C-methylase UbiE
MKPYFKRKSPDFRKKLDEIKSIMDLHFKEYQKYDIDSEIYLSGLLDDLNIVFENTKKTDEILDLGCGKGHVSAMMSLYFKKVESIDVENASEEGSIFNAKILGKGWHRKVWKEFEKKYSVRYRYYDGKKIPFEDGSFDVVVANAVIEHVDDVDVFLKEIKRVLKKEGKLFIFRCPQKYSLTENFAKIVGIGHHDVLYSKNELMGVLRRNHFSINLIGLYDIFPAFIPGLGQQKMNLIGDPIIMLQKILQSLRITFLAHNWRVMAQKEK